MQDRLENRLAELENERKLINQPSIVMGGALVLPASMLEDRPPGLFARETKAIEEATMRCVMDIERSLGHIPRDVSADRLGWDIESTVPAPSGDGRRSTLFIEVNGRRMGATTVTVTRNELVTALNQPENYRLAIVEVDGERTRCEYFVRPFSEDAVHSVNYNIDDIMRLASNRQIFE